MTGRTAPCTCPRSHHEHGNVMRYRKDGCRCTLCRDAHCRYEKRRRLRAMQNRGPDHVDPTVTREHIARLLAAGMSLRGVSRQSGVSTKTVQDVHHGTQPTIRRTTQDAILGLTPAILPHAWVTATGATRRIRALAVLGYSHTRLAALLGVAPTTVHLIAGGQARIEAATDQAIRRVYRELLTRPARPATKGDRVSIGRTRAHAARNGWVGPLAWDDIDRDPAPVATEPYQPAPLIDQIAELGDDLTADQIANRLGIHRDTVYRTLAHARKAAA